MTGGWRLGAGRLATTFLAVIAAGTAFVHGQQGTGQTPAQWPLSNSVRERGSSVTGAYEGWFYNTDGSISLLLGYFNRNSKQEFDIPVGPNNRIEGPDGPGVADRGQPTHFLNGRQWGVFTIKVSKDFTGKKLAWTIVSNGQTNTITMHTRPEWIVSPFEDPANKNTPPAVKFAADGPTFTGPPASIAATYTVTLPNTLPLPVWVTDEGPKINIPEAPPSRGRGRGAAPAAPPRPALSITWTAFRGPAAVKFDNEKPAIDREAGGTATTTATFTEPGEYILRVQGNDSTGEGGGGFQCCWTNAHVKVTVKPASPSGQ